MLRLIDVEVKNRDPKAFNKEILRWIGEPEDKLCEKCGSETRWEKTTEEKFRFRCKNKRCRNTVGEILNL